jgi:hypothetical protein
MVFVIKIIAVVKKDIVEKLPITVLSVKDVNLNLVFVNKSIPKK